MNYYLVVVVVEELLVHTQAVHRLVAAHTSAEVHTWVVVRTLVAHSQEQADTLLVAVGNQVVVEQIVVVVLQVYKLEVVLKHCLKE